MNEFQFARVTLAHFFAKILHFSSLYLILVYLNKLKFTCRAILSISLFTVCIRLLVCNAFLAKSVLLLLPCAHVLLLDYFINPWLMI